MSGVNNVIIVEKNKEEASLIKCREVFYFYLRTAYLSFKSGMLKVKQHNMEVIQRATTY